MKGNAALWGPGMALFLATWAGTWWGGLSHDEYVAIPSLVPIAGPFASAALAANEGHSGSATLYALSGLLQMAGFTMWIAGGVSKHPVLVRKHVDVGLSMQPGGGALTLRY